jgi:hypothetical protein
MSHYLRQGSRKCEYWTQRLVTSFEATALTWLIPVGTITSAQRLLGSTNSKCMGLSTTIARKSTAGLHNSSTSSQALPASNETHARSSSSDQRLVAYLTVLTYWDMTESTLLPLSFTSRCKRRISRMSASVSTNTCRRKEDNPFLQSGLNKSYGDTHH